MSIQDLVNIVAPPDAPQPVGDLGVRSQVEAKLGTALPCDYWELAAAYGSGQFQTENFEFVVYNPFEDGYCRAQEIDSESMSLVPDCPYGVYPNFPCLISWGGDANGTMLFFHTVGAPNEWSIVVFDGEFVFQEFQMSLTEFLVAAIQRSINCMAWEEAEAFWDGLPPNFMPRP